MSEQRTTVCLDFDGVVHLYASGWQGIDCIPDPPVDGAFEFMHRLLCAGHDVAIHSSRCRSWRGRRAIQEWLVKHCPDGLYQSTPAAPGIDSVRVVRDKPSAVVTLDDRAVRFSGTWPQDVERLVSLKPWNRLS